MKTVVVIILTGVQQSQTLVIIYEVASTNGKLRAQALFKKKVSVSCDKVLHIYSGTFTCQLGLDITGMIMLSVTVCDKDVPFIVMPVRC